MLRGERSGKRAELGRHRRKQEISALTISSGTDLHKPLKHLGNVWCYIVDGEP